MKQALQSPVDSLRAVPPRYAIPLDLVSKLPSYRPVNLPYNFDSGEMILRELYYQEVDRSDK